MKTLEIGYEQLIVFITTIIAVLATDLLVGVAIGMVAEFLVHVLRSVHWDEVLKLYHEVEETEPGVYHVRIDGAAFFANFLSLKSELASLPDGRKLIFDLSEAETIDHTVMEFIHHYCEDYQRRGGSCETRGLHLHKAMSRHPLAARRRVGQFDGGKTEFRRFSSS